MAGGLFKHRGNLPLCFNPLAFLSAWKSEITCRQDERQSWRTNIWIIRY